MAKENSRPFSRPLFRAYLFAVSLTICETWLLSVRVFFFLFLDKPLG